MMRRVRIGDVLRLRREPIVVDPFETYVSIGVRGFGRGIFHYEPRLGSEIGQLRFFRVRPNELVISNIKAWEGAIALSDDDDQGTVASNRFLTYESDLNSVDLGFVRYLLLSRVGLPLIQRASPGSADRNRTLAIARFEALEIPLPNIDEQRRVAAHLDKVHTAVRRSDQRRSKMQTRSRALVASLATQPQMSAEGKEAGGWKRHKLGGVLQQYNEPIDVEIEATYPNIGIYSFGRGVFKKPPIDGLETSAKKLNRVRAGQFIYSRLFAFEGAYAFVPDRFDGYFVSNEFPTFDVDAGMAIAEFIAATLRSPQQWAVLGGSSKGLGLRRQRIQVDALLQHEVWLPPIEQQQRIVAGLRKLDRLDALTDQVQTLSSAVYPSALNRAFAELI